jgi:type IV pilus assembly protein PilA
MLARIRKSMEEREEGFTLIELLVVMIIIGILAAIAIPVFLSQKSKGYDASMKSDLRTIANELESYNTDGNGYPAAQAAVVSPITIGASTVRTSANNTFTWVYNTAATGFCIVASDPKASHNWVYISTQGGLQLSSVIACPAANSAF